MLEQVLVDGRDKLMPPNFELTSHCQADFFCSLFFNEKDILRTGWHGSQKCSALWSGTFQLIFFERRKCANRNGACVWDGTCYLFFKTTRKHVSTMLSTRFFFFCSEYDCVFFVIFEPQVDQNSKFRLFQSKKFLIVLKEGSGTNNLYSNYHVENMAKFSTWNSGKNVITRVRNTCIILDVIWQHPSTGAILFVVILTWSESWTMACENSGIHWTQYTVQICWCLWHQRKV